ncbi:MAG: hypothetical protein HY220_01030 [Candidatus Sungbacteria bacterium]|uniref:Phosphomannomutase/phosphoglucomutase n=1 Tax=Candidatus Sungiibacteriota bacterium TaxID=2750080 RepID=A0A9D6LTB5_9BACT|nr:hypothetical protein [Candidatus Sungbacteria bacterium]
MQVNPAIFRSYDIRGIYPDELSPEAAKMIGIGYAEFLRRVTKHSHPTVLVGRDTRFSSDTLHQKLVEGLIRNGAAVVDIGIGTTPELYFLTLTRHGIEGGIMITASHNQPEYNGFKFLLSRLGDIGLKNGLQRIRKFGEKKLRVGIRIGKVKSIAEQDRYLSKLRSFVPKIPQIRVLVNAAGGATSFLLPSLLGSYPVVYKPIFFDPDPTFEHHPPNPLLEGVETNMKLEMKSTKFHLGVCFDGDGDRVSFFDEKGNRIRADIVFALLARESLEKHRGRRFAFELTHAKFLRPFIETYGGELIDTKVGRIDIRRVMTESQAVLGGETSAHVYHQELQNIDSALLTMLKMFRVVGKLSRPISEVVSGISSSSFLQKAILVNHQKSVIQKFANTYKNSTRSMLDGVTVQYPTWWFNIRASNTESLVRLTLETGSGAESASRLKSLTAEVMSYD